MMLITVFSVSCKVDPLSVVKFPMDVANNPSQLDVNTQLPIAEVVPMLVALRTSYVPSDFFSQSSFPVRKLRPVVPIYSLLEHLHESSSDIDDTRINQRDVALRRIGCTLDIQGQEIVF